MRKVENGHTDLEALQFGLKMDGLRHPERQHVIVEIHEDKLCIWPTATQKEPTYLDLAGARKALPKLVEFILNEGRNI